jgi:hypothetical protein
VPFVLDPLGLEGVVWIMSAASAIVVVLTLIATRRIEQLDFPWRAAIVQSLLVAAAAAAVTSLEAAFTLPWRAATLVATGMLTTAIWLLPNRKFITSLLRS